MRSIQVEVHAGCVAGAAWCAAGCVLRGAGAPCRQPPSARLPAHDLAEEGAGFDPPPSVPLGALLSFVESGLAVTRVIEPVAAVDDPL